MKKQFSSKILLLFLILLLASCTTKAQLTGVWVDDTIGDYTIDNVLVIGITRDTFVQKLWENVFTSRLAQENVKAMASYATVGTKIKPERKSVEDAIRKSGAKTVLISRVIDSTTNIQTLPGRRTSALGIYGFYDLSVKSTYVPPSTIVKKVVRLETNFYDVATEKLIWTSQVDVFDPEMTKVVYDRVIGLLIEDLRLKNLL